VIILRHCLGNLRGTLALAERALRFAFRLLPGARCALGCTWCGAIGIEAFARAAISRQCAPLRPTIANACLPPAAHTPPSPEHLRTALRHSCACNEMFYLGIVACLLLRHLSRAAEGGAALGPPRRLPEFFARSCARSRDSFVDVSISTWRASNRRRRDPVRKLTVCRVN
jgi:hypothetical protein